MLTPVPAVPTAPPDLIAPAAVRYIKLGRGGAWEQECVATSTMRMGFGTEDPTLFRLCHRRDWAGLTTAFRTRGETAATATRFANELRLFCADAGTTLWITFAGESLYWGFLDESPAMCHPDGDGVVRSVRGGWRRTDRAGALLTKDRLSGALNKLAAYRGTSCAVDVADYIVRRINGQKLPVVDDALSAVDRLRQSLRALLDLLTPQDFELLVDLVFTTSGWRRVGAIGGVQKTIDLDLVLPSTGERAFVQVKSRTTPAQLHDYLARLDALQETHSRMFFVYHQGTVSCADPRVTLIGPDGVAAMVIEAGLTRWLIEKVS